jgi:hypothetical protein
LDRSLIGNLSGQMGAELRLTAGRFKNTTM